MNIGYNPKEGYQKLAIALVIIASALCAEAAPSGPIAKPPYTVSVFAAPPAGLTNPDSITTANGNIFVVYANATNPDGTGGFSTIVEYSPTGKVLSTFDVLGKADGLKYNPFDHKLWALRNEDSNPALTIIDPTNGLKTDYTYAQLPLHGGGYDDVVFMNGETFISASNPTVDANGQNNFPSIVKASLVGSQVFVTPVLEGNASLIDIVTGRNVVSLQSDPDSLKVDSVGDLVLDSQADGDLIFINAPGSPNQVGHRLHLNNGTSTQITVDDTVFPTDRSGTIYVVDTKGDTVYAVTSDGFQPGGAYSASDSDGILGKVDLNTGLVTPIVTGMMSPHGALFVSGIKAFISYSGDFNGDGKQDVLWRNTQTGEVRIWYMNGSTILSDDHVDTVSLDWKIVGIADFNGDGISDILWENVNDGSFAVWTMRGDSAVSHQYSSPGLQWSITGVADLDHNGLADILWRNLDTGEVRVWSSIGPFNFLSESIGVASLDWNLVGTVDLFGDGHPELIWQNQNTGEVRAWRLSGDTIVANVSLGFASLDWKIAGFGDFTGTGRQDILWRNTSDGSVDAWIMNGFTIVAQWFPGAVSLDWQIRATPDVNGNRVNSIFWSNISTGQQAIWTSTGSTFVPGAPFADADPTWVVQPSVSEENLAP